jgi:hypothetical protein
MSVIFGSHPFLGVQEFTIPADGDYRVAVSMARYGAAVLKVMRGDKCLTQFTMPDTRIIPLTAGPHHIEVMGAAAGVSVETLKQ